MIFNNLMKLKKKENTFLSSSLNGGVVYNNISYLVVGGGGGGPSYGGGGGGGGIALISYSSESLSPFNEFSQQTLKDVEKEPKESKLPDYSNFTRYLDF